MSQRGQGSGEESVWPRAQPRLREAIARLPLRPDCERQKMLSGRTTTREPSKACEHRRREQAQWRELNKGLNSRAEQPGLCHLCRQGPELRPPGSGRVPRAAHTLSSRTVPCALVPREATSPGHRPEGGGPDPEMSTTPGVGELGSDATQSGSVAALLTGLPPRS